ncbi:transposase [Flavobacterium covae]|uniref:transposase n=1 Tax=Flavobacterium covae TaxID=2906076 RepID=UPI0007C51DBC|nr:transposase [Flavobacterium covae]
MYFRGDKKQAMAKVTFKNQTGNSPELFPINIFDKIDDNHPVRLVDSIVDRLDISDIVKLYRGGGCSAYHPRMLIKVLFYKTVQKVRNLVISTKGRNQIMLIKRALLT